MTRWIRSLNLMLLASAVLFVGCGSNNDTQSTGSGPSAVALATTFAGNQSPGNTWRITVNGGSFTAQDTTRGLTYSGTVSPLPTGYLQFTTTTTNDRSISPPVTSFGVLAAGSLLAFEAPAPAQIAPASQAAPIVATVPIGPCPTDSATAPYNGVAMTTSSWTSANSTYTVFNNTLNAGVLTETYLDFSLSGAQTDSGNSTYTCSDGIFTSGPVTLTPSRDLSTSIIALNGAEPTVSSFVNLSAPSANLSLEALTAVRYVGFTSTVNLAGSGGGETPISASPGAAGTSLTANEVDPSNGTRLGGSRTITFTGQPFPGIVTASIQEGGVTVPAVFAAAQRSGRFLLVGIRFVPAQNQSETLILIQTP